MCLLGFVLAGCGGKSEAQKVREAAAKSGRGTVTCSGTATTGAIGLPAGFPEIEAVTVVESVQKGPTRVVDGYADRSLEELYDDYMASFESGGHSVLFDEIEANDAEVSYRLKDELTEGIVALRSCDYGRTSVHITNRPS